MRISVLSLAFSFVFGSRGPASPLTLTVLPQAFADSFGAKCLDGSPPALYTLPTGQPNSNWVLFLEGGGWCFSVSDCISRSRGGGGSSKGMAANMVVGGLLSPDPAVNPRFASNTSFAFLHYCDGSSMTSNNSQSVNGTWHRGRPNLIALVSYLRSALGAASPSEVIVSGGSAGALAAYAAADVVCALFPGSRCVAAPDAGWFLDASTVNNPHNFAFRDNFIAADLAMWKSTTTGGLPSQCLAAYDAAGELWRCFFAQYSVLYTATPVHAMMSAYDLYSFPNIFGLPCIPPACSAAQLQLLQEWRFQQVGSIAAGLNGFPGSGAYVDSCLVHEQNVAYCQAQSLPNCRGWNLYNMTVPGFNAQLTPQEGFSLWYNTLMANWEAVSAARAVWKSRVTASLAHGAAAYPRRNASEAAAFAALSPVQLFDPLPWPENLSCPYGTNSSSTFAAARVHANLRARQLNKHGVQ